MLFDAGRGGGCCFRVVVTRTQLTKLIIERNPGKTVNMCAMKAGMSRKMAGKYLSQDKVLERRRVPHIWKTRKDPLAEIWPKAQEMLQDAPELEAKALLSVWHQPDPAGWRRSNCGRFSGECGIDGWRTERARRHFSLRIIRRGKRWRWIGRRWGRWG